jgi:hypothetical protein
VKLKNGALHVRRLTYAALCLALALVLPFLTGQIPEIGSMLCPMHIPALLCGFLCGWPWGLLVGGTAPILRSLIFSRPPMFSAIGMAFELAVYGAVAGILYRVLPKTKGSIYVTLITAMVAGRVVWGGVQMVMMGLQDSAFTMEAFLAGAITNAVPGIILQIILIPVIVMALDKAKLIPEN